MPYKLKRVNIRKNCYTVYNPLNKHVFSKCSTKTKAKKQIKLLHAIMYNPNFKPYGQKVVQNYTYNKHNKHNKHNTHKNHNKHNTYKKHNTYNKHNKHNTYNKHNKH